MNSTQQQLSSEDRAALDQMRDDAPAPVADDAAQPDTAGAPTEQSQDQAPETEQASSERRQTMVPHAALHEEREARKKLERDLQAEREARSLLDQRTNLILQSMAQRQAAPEEPALPSIEQDPVGHLVGKQQAIERQVKEQGDQSQQQQQAIAQHIQALAIQQAITQRAQGLEQEFKADHPDYDDAVHHLMKARHQELALLGKGHAERAAMVQQEGFTLAVHALQNNMNPASIIYDLAKMRGFAGSAQAKPQSTGQQQPTGTQRLENIAAGQQASRSLGDMRGGGRPPALTAQRLLEMSNDEFYKMIHTPEGKALLG